MSYEVIKVYRFGDIHVVTFSKSEIQDKAVSDAIGRDLETLYPNLIDGKCIVNMNGVTIFDSNAIWELLMFRNRINKDGNEHSLILCHVDARVGATFEILKQLQNFERKTDLPTALEHLGYVPRSVKKYCWRNMARFPRVILTWLRLRTRL